MPPPAAPAAPDGPAAAGATAGGPGATAANAGATTDAPGSSDPGGSRAGAGEDGAAPTHAADGNAADGNAADGNAADGGDGADPDAPPDWQAFVPTDVADHLATMDKAAQDSGCGVPWHLLAAISRVESDFGRNMATSSAGAVGYGQFLPSSWQAFGNDGNVYDYRDALPAIATYLCQSGLERDPRAALYAYNHADWYVDLVLDLAVRYDRMAPGAPTPDVLELAPAADSGVQLLYAPGRDVRLQARARAGDRGVWLGVPWSGRVPGVAISFGTLETTALTMVRGAFGFTSDPPKATDPGSDETTALANFAWRSGLLPLPLQPLVSHAAADRQPTDAQALLGQIRRQVALGRPLIALLDARSMPGHPPDEAIGDQPVVIVGATADGVVYNDPTFSSSLGYGLEMHDADFLKAWQAAGAPLQAFAFTPKPDPLPRDFHLRGAEPPPVYARVVFTPTPRPTAGPVATPVPLIPPAAAAAEHPRAASEAAVQDSEAAAPPDGSAESNLASECPSKCLVADALDAPASHEAGLPARDDAASRAVDAGQPGEPVAVARGGSVAVAGGDDDRSWLLLVGAGVLAVAGAVFRRRRGRRSV